MCQRVSDTLRFVSLTLVFDQESALRRTQSLWPPSSCVHHGEHAPGRPRSPASPCSRACGPSPGGSGGSTGRWPAAGGTPRSADGAGTASPRIKQRLSLNPFCTIPGRSRDTEPAKDITETITLAATALMLEVARSDQVKKDVELKTIESILADTLNINQERVLTR